MIWHQRRKRAWRTSLPSVLITVSILRRQARVWASYWKAKSNKYYLNIVTLMKRLPSAIRSSNQCCTQCCSGSRFFKKCWSSFGKANWSIKSKVRTRWAENYKWTQRKRRKWTTSKGQSKPTKQRSRSRNRKKKSNKTKRSRSRNYTSPWWRRNHMRLSIWNCIINRLKIR